MITSRITRRPSQAERLRVTRRAMMMLVRTHPDGAVETLHRPRALPMTLAIAGGVGLAVIAVGASRWPPVVSALLGGVSVLCVWAAWIQRMPTRFMIEPARRRVRWRRPSRAGIASVSGECPFEDVRQVVLQPGPGRTNPRVRIALLHTEGLVPMARDFTLERAPAAEIAERLRSLIGLESGARVQERVLQVARADGDAAAISMLRERDGLSEDQARDLLAHLKER